MNDQIAFVLILAVLVAFVATAIHPYGPFATSERRRRARAKARRLRVIRRAHFGGK